MDKSGLLKKIKSLPDHLFLNLVVLFEAENKVFREWNNPERRAENLLEWAEEKNQVLELKGHLESETKSTSELIEQAQGEKWLALSLSWRKLTELPGEIGRLANLTWPTDQGRQWGIAYAGKGGPALSCG